MIRPASRVPDSENSVSASGPSMQTMPAITLAALFSTYLTFTYFNLRGMPSNIVRLFNGGALLPYPEEDYCRATHATADPPARPTPQCQDWCEENDDEAIFKEHYNCLSMFPARPSPPARSMTFPPPYL